MADDASQQEGQSSPGPYAQLNARLTERARKAIALAQDEARRYAHPYLGTEHLLLGLVDTEQGIGAVALRSLGADEAKVRSAVDLIVGRGDRADMESEVEMTPRALTAMSLAADEARRMGHSYIGTEHMLLGLLDEGEGVAAGVLQSLGIGVDAARREIVNLLNQKTPADVAVAKSNVITCRISGRDLDAIDALVESGVRSTRSDAAAWLLHAGIEANRELLDKVYGTVMEIRRLREEVARSLQEPAAG